MKPRRIAGSAAGGGQRESANDIFQLNLPMDKRTSFLVGDAKTPPQRRRANTTLALDGISEEG